MDNKKLVQHIRTDISGVPKEGLYCYNEADFETNLAMQEPLAKLYRYENQPDMRAKVTEYISELEAEIDRCQKLAVQNMDDGAATAAEMMAVRVQTLTEVKNDLQGRLEEIV